MRPKCSERRYVPVYTRHARRQHDDDDDYDDEGDDDTNLYYRCCLLNALPISKVDTAAVIVSFLAGMPVTRYMHDSLALANPRAFVRYSTLLL